MPCHGFVRSLTSSTLTLRSLRLLASESIWQFSGFFVASVYVATDCRVVGSWIDNTTEGRDRARTKGTAQMMIKQRLMVIKEVANCRVSADG